MTARDPLVALGAAAGEFADIAAASMYAGDVAGAVAIPGALHVVAVRRSLALRLRRAQHDLPTTITLVVLDGHRPLGVQRSLYRRVCDALSAANPGLNPEAVAALAERYVSRPSASPPSPHLSGGAVDVFPVRLPTRLASQLRGAADAASGGRDVPALHALVLGLGRPLTMGSPVDHAGPASSPSAGMRGAAQVNRTLLSTALSAAGLRQHPHEWWHWELAEVVDGGLRPAVRGPRLRQAERHQQPPRVMLRVPVADIAEIAVGPLPGA